MSQITRTWLGFAAIGAGLVHLALVVSAPLPIAIVLVLLGIAEFGWGVLTFANDRLIAPRIARAVAIAPVIGWSLLVVGAALLDAAWLASSLPLVPMAIATIFGLFASGVLSRHIRRMDDPEDAAEAPPMPGAPRYLAALMAGGILVGALTAPALAATEAGKYAQPHGEHTADYVPAQVDPARAGDPLAELNLPEHERH